MKLHRLLASGLVGLAFFGMVIPGHGVVADIVTTSIYLIGEDEFEDEDAYVASSSARVDGTIDGDLVISTGSLSIAGEVTGDVLVISHGTVRVTGTVGGSLRGSARTVVVEGTVGDDVAVAALTTRVSGVVARDSLVFGGSFTLEGEVGRNVAGRMVTATVDGEVGNDVDIAVGRLTLGGDAVVHGDVLYRSGSDAEIAATAQVESQLQRLPTRGSFGTEVVLTIATVLGFFAFLFAGLILLWLFRTTAPRAVATIRDRPLRAAAVGVGALLALPLAIVVLMLTLVGTPVAIALLGLLVLALLFAPVPAVTALGGRLLRDRAGLFASFILGAVLWRLGIWLIPLVGLALYLGALAAGLGGWLVATRDQRRETRSAGELLPSRDSTGEVEARWEAPLAPGSGRDDAAGEGNDVA